ncbi:MAG: uncharacterized protein JWO98_5340 [Frankiales bacterium]|nr:uncharacterized protein [Frankiales bacterium]
MPGGTRSEVPSPLAGLIAKLDDLTRRITTLETPTASDKNQTVAKLQSLVSDIQAELDDYIATGTYNKSQLDTKFAAKLDTTGSLPAGQVTGTLGNDINNGTTNSSTVVGGVVKTTSGPSTNITATRVASWLQSSDGTIGTASSSRRYKTTPTPAEIAPSAVLAAMTVYQFSYLAEVAKRDDPASENYVGPDYHVAVNVGVMAEDLHAAGLWQFVVYARQEGGDELKLDDAGQPIPDGVHYELLALACLAVLHDHEDRLSKLEGDA